MKTVTLEVVSRRDVTRRALAWLDVGLLETTVSKRVIFSFDAIRVEFTLHAA